MKSRLVVGLLTPLSLVDSTYGKHFLELLVQTAPDLSPELYGNFEPLKTPFRSAAESAPSWKPPFLWKRTTGQRAQGAVWFGNPGSHSAIYLTATGRRQPADQAIAFVQAAAMEFSIHFGYLHLLTEQETEAPQTTYDMWYPIDIGITSNDLKKGIPNVCWAMILGPPYVRLIGRDRLLSASCFCVKELSREHVYLQVTAKIEDLREGFEDFEEVRRRLKAELGEELFLPRVGDGMAKSIPEFAL